MQEAPKFANHIGYSDVNPYEVVRVVSDKCLEVRAMDAEKDPAWEPEWVVGGFAAVCVNQHAQQWVIKSAPSNPVIRIRLGKSGQWKSPSGGRFVPGNEPIKFYDYNF